MDLFLLQEGDEQDPILNFAFSPPEPPFVPTPILSDSFGVLNQARVDNCQNAPVIQSVFRTYEGTSIIHGSSSLNVHERLFSFINEIPAKIEEKPREQSGTVESTRGFRHMMRERIRRERMSQGYADLHSLLPSNPTKSDKHTIVKTGIRYLQELKNEKERLQKRYEELESASKRRMENRNGVVIELRVSSSALPAIDSLPLVLHTLRLLNLKISSFRSEFSNGVLLVTVGVEIQDYEKDELQNSVMNTLSQTEREISMIFPLRNKWIISCNVGNQ